MDQKTKEFIENEINNNEVCLFMKGTPEAPQCGFSMAVSNILKILEVNFKGINVLESGELRQGIKESIPDAEITIEDLAGDNNHYSATIKSKLFKGKSKIEQHKLVYKSLKGKMGNELHALALNTLEK